MDGTGGLDVNKQHKLIAESVINCDPQPWIRHGITEDKFNTIIDRPDVREYVKAARDRMIFLSGQHAVKKLLDSMQPVQPGVRRTNLQPSDIKAIELSLKINGISLKKPIADKGETGVDELIDPDVVPN